MNDEVCSIRMHASLAGEHLSGGEQLVPFERLQQQALLLLQRALTHERGEADAVRITIDPIQSKELIFGSLPQVESHTCEILSEAKAFALRLLEAAGVAPPVARAAMEKLATGPAPGNRVMRGAMLIDCRSGERLEPDMGRGVRVSCLGIEPSAAQQLESMLQQAGLDATRVSEALVLASKVMSAADVVAELCWSDDPSYVTGYVASAGVYTRLTPLKLQGDAFGGRVFFIRPGADINALIDYLENKPFLVRDLGTADQGIKNC